MRRSRRLVWSKLRRHVGDAPAGSSARELPVRVTLPNYYEPNYPYPLLVLFHGNGGNEKQVMRLVPQISQRNYICISLRGPEVLSPSATPRPCFGWGNVGEYDTLVEEYLLQAIQCTARRYHIHTERIYLAGFCEGAQMAYRIGLNHPDRWGGLISLNGSMPNPREAGPLMQPQQIRHFRVFMGHGIANAIVPLSLARRDFGVLYALGAEVSLHTYPTTHRLHPDMLRDVDRWIMDQVNAEVDSLLIDEHPPWWID